MGENALFLFWLILKQNFLYTKDNYLTVPHNVEVGCAGITKSISDKRKNHLYLSSLFLPHAILPLHWHKG